MTKGACDCEIHATCSVNLELITMTMNTYYKARETPCRCFSTCFECSKSILESFQMVIKVMEIPTGKITHLGRMKG